MNLQFDSNLTVTAIYTFLSSSRLDIPSLTDKTKVMTFVSNARQIAIESLAELKSPATSKFLSVLDFMIKNPDLAGIPRGVTESEIGSEKHINRLALQFTEGRKPRFPQAPSTVPDALVGLILENYFDANAEEISSHEEWHLKSMGAESIVGDLLERYLAETLEPTGWLWCSGSVVRAVDFIYPSSIEKNEYELLQVKNRDNSENSSSSAIRTGTNIKKWFRTYSRTGKFNWDKFPDEAARDSLSEEAFHEFVIEYIQNLKSS